jgi:hypothetical protein
VTVTPRVLGVLVALPVVAALAAGVVLMSGDDEPAGSLPPELSSAIRRSLDADRIHVESPGVTEDFVAPDRLATEYSINGQFREIIVGRTAYFADLDGGYLSCVLPERATARSAARVFSLLKSLRRARLLAERDHGRYRVRIDNGIQPNGQSQTAEVSIGLRDGLVRSVTAMGASTNGKSTSFTYGRAQVDVPVADQVRAVADCDEAAPKVTASSGDQPSVGSTGGR